MCVYLDWTDSYFTQFWSWQHVQCMQMLPPPPVFAGYTPGGSFQFCLHRPSTALKHHPPAPQPSFTPSIPHLHKHFGRVRGCEFWGTYPFGPEQTFGACRSNRAQQQQSSLGFYLPSCGGFPGNCPQVCVVELMVWDLGRVCVQIWAMLLLLSSCCQQPPFAFSVPLSPQPLSWHSVVELWISATEPLQLWCWWSGSAVYQKATE